MYVCCLSVCVSQKTDDCHLNNSWLSNGNIWILFYPIRICMLYRKYGELLANVATRQIVPAVEATACQHLAAGCWLLAVLSSLHRKKSNIKKKCVVALWSSWLGLFSCHHTIASRAVFNHEAAWMLLQYRWHHRVSFGIRWNILL